MSLILTLWQFAVGRVPAKPLPHNSENHTADAVPTPLAATQIADASVAWAPSPHCVPTPWPQPYPGLCTLV